MLTRGPSSRTLALTYARATTPTAAAFRTSMERMWARSPSMRRGLSPSWSTGRSAASFSTPDTPISMPRWISRSPAPRSPFCRAATPRPIRHSQTSPSANRRSSASVRSGVRPIPAILPSSTPAAPTTPPSSTTRTWPAPTPSSSPTAISTSGTPSWMPTLCTPSCGG